VLHLTEEGGMQSEVIRTGKPLLTNDVARRVQDEGTYYDVDGEGNVRKVPDEGPPLAQAAMMIPIEHEGTVVGVVQLMSDHVSYDTRQLALAEGLIALLGAAVRNARLHQERVRLEAATAAAEAVSAERERAAQVLEAVGDGIFAVGADGTIGFWNRGAETITRLSADAVRGRSLAELAGGWDVVEGAVPPARAGERPQAVTLPVELGGRELWLSFVAVRSTDSVVYAFRDLTLERELEQSKHDFIATVSHELRTPMTGVLGAARTLLRDDLELPPETVRELIEMIAAQAARLARVTESVLLAGRLDRAEVTVDTRRVDVDEVVREALHALEQSLAGEAQIDAELTAPGPALGDASRLQQVVVNLVDNAAKYSDGVGAVRVRTYGDARTVGIEVSDRGRGIRPADLDRVFDKFYRSEDSRRLAPDGTGLGLYICRELVELMGGRIRASSTPGAGSTFTVELPAAS
jgi:two-component system phosphate regulon sensor histidine kinase PhoR